MAILQFEDLSFEAESDRIKVLFLKNFYTYIPTSLLKQISDYTINKASIVFEKISDNKAKTKFNFLLENAFEDLKNRLNNNKTVYIHKNSGIPLMGSLSFGIVDKGSQMLEVKPITGCNLNCIYCSVDEGLSTRKIVDFVVEKDYLVSELRRLIEFKDTQVDVYINPHGEPLLYAGIVPLVKDIAGIKNAKVISIITNGTLLTKELADELIKAGLNKINISLCALNDKLATRLAGANYNVKHVLDMISYLKEKIEVVIAPVYISGVNDEDIVKLIELCKKMPCKIFIQNFLFNERGRNPTKQVSWDIFYQKLKSLEKIYGIELIPKGKIVQTKEYKMPFKKGDIIKPNHVIPGRYSNENIASFNNRCITVSRYSTRISDVKITKSSHNIFYGKLI